MNKKKLYIYRLFNFRLALIDYYLINELSYFFLFSVGLFSSLGITLSTISDLAYKITEYNLPIKIAIKVFCLKLPEFIAYALPISMLLTTLVTYGRLSHDSELIACRSVGISIFRLILPALIFSLMVIGITFVFNEIVVPAANYQATIIQEQFIPETSFSLQRKDIYYPEYEKSNHQTQKSLKRLYYAESFDGKNLRNLTIISWAENQLSQIIVSQSASWDQTQKLWNLVNGSINYFTENISNNFSKQFDYLQLPLAKTLFALVSQERNPEEMNIAQASQYLDLIKLTDDDKNIRLFQVRIQQKYAFPFICLVFAAIGSTLGASSQNIGRAKSFGFTALIVFVYYLFSFLVNALGLVGVLSPFLASWLPNFLGLGLAFWLLIKTSL
ncbi:permease YjgP/YjgQ family protein [Stanieria cyanosphaera PCC 7437]|uniref:Permease YjgP/YjgQ family protein n=2 Tax=Stanieria cyanosphaera TaxID=102116 RepID=K9XWV8_STAC7|nr:permease YjgP/YjgQ family protein [Stanieria cyanosphaera PCC 7437]